MSEPTSPTVDCPICGEGFDPTAAGGWCTNPDCGEWQYLGDEVPDPADADEGAAAAAEPDGDPDADEPAEPAVTEAADEDAAEPATDAGQADTAPSDAAQAGTAGAEDGPEYSLEFVSASAEEDAEGSVEDDPEDPIAEADMFEPKTPESAEEDEEAVDVDREAVEDPAGHDVDKDERDEPERADESAACPDCGTTVDADANFCPDCGADLGEDADEAAGLEACPACGDEVAADDDFCASCGEDLAAAREVDGAETRLALRVRGEAVLVNEGQTVGREIRRILTDTGGDEDDAVRIHREHVRFVREDGQFYLVDLGDNPTEVNGTRLSKGDREPVDAGDEIGLSDVVTISVDTP